MNENIEPNNREVTERPFQSNKQGRHEIPEIPAVKCGNCIFWSKTFGECKRRCPPWPRTAATHWCGDFTSIDLEWSVDMALRLTGLSRGDTSRERHDDSV